MLGNSKSGVYLFGYFIGGGGHGWVADQSRNDVRQRAVYTNGVNTGVQYEYREFIHMNWGWNGAYNGYFYPTNFHTDQAFEYDPGSSYVGGPNYQYNLEMNYKIYK